MLRKMVHNISQRNNLFSQKNACSFVIAIMLTAGCVLLSHPAKASQKEFLLPSGSYLPFFSPKSSKDKRSSDDVIKKPVTVQSFWMDTYPVSNGDFLEFVKDNPDWRRSKVSRIFADDSYLKHWKGDLSLKTPKDLNRPVIHISWFAAQAYCESLGRELPTTDQWEYAVNNGGQHQDQIKQAIIAWYSEPNSKSLPNVKATSANHYGIRALIGVIWEWTLDFNNTMMGSELRNSGIKQEDLFCGAGSLGALDASDYAKFMRYSFRGSLKADYTTANLGFRCAREAAKK